MFWTFLDKVDGLAKLQNSDFQSHFFDKFNFKNNLFLKLGRKNVKLSEKLQKKIGAIFVIPPVLASL